MSIRILSLCGRRRGVAN